MRTSRETLSYAAPTHAQYAPPFATPSRHMLTPAMMLFSLPAYFNAINVSCSALAAGERVASISVFAVPPNESWQTTHTLLNVHWAIQHNHAGNPACNADSVCVCTKAWQMTDS
eukprot:1140501-Amphidinium_carterae.1